MTPTLFLMKIYSKPKLSESISHFQNAYGNADQERGKQNPRKAIDVKRLHIGNGHGGKRRKHFKRTRKQENDVDAKGANERCQRTFQKHTEKRADGGDDDHRYDKGKKRL